MSVARVLGIVLVITGLTGCETLTGEISGEGTGRVESGKMSWYSVKTNGGTTTASGEKFSDSAQTAAHRTLPFGSKVKVTNLENGKTAVVKITDRGPFIKGRIIDVSIGVARDLDFVGRGVVPCQIVVLR